MPTTLKLISKEDLIREFKKIEAKGWIQVPANRRNNDGSVGNLLEDLLGIPENNLPIPNAAEWELKAQRASTTSLVTLCHMEPSPRAAKLVPNMLIPNYGWPHIGAGGIYPADERSFRATLNATTFTDRGFKVNVNRKEERIEIIFDSKKCDVSRHSDWLNEVNNNVGLGPFPTLPYWGFNDLYTKVGTKLINCFFVQAETKREGGSIYYHYNSVLMLKGVDKSKFIDAIENGIVFVDFDARTGHNHGTKFRIKNKDIPSLYAEAIKIV